MNNLNILMPINERFHEVFNDFMDENQKNKMRANNVRQYAEGIINLLLRAKIEPFMRGKEMFEGLSIKKKLEYLEKNYDEEITEKLRKIFEIGGKGSHFDGVVTDIELNTIVETAIHIVEDIFVKYFLEPNHRFGSEDIFTVFSMLPLRHRIYILERVMDSYINQDVIDRLSLAYFKNSDEEKAINLLKDSLRNGNIDENFYNYQHHRLSMLKHHLPTLYQLNSDCDDISQMKAIVDHQTIVVGMPTSKNIFDTQKALNFFPYWYEINKDKYTEFTNLFFYLMLTDDRTYS